MPHLISNLYEKSYTPFTAKLAPRNLWNRPVLERQPQKTNRYAQSAPVKAFWRGIRTYICHNHKAYYMYVLVSSFALYNVTWAIVIGNYRRENHHRGLEFAMQAEKEWQLIKPKDDDDDDEDEEEEE